MSYKGKYYPSFPRKYKGDPTNIIYRSLWERKFMVYCDKNQNILEWASEEIAIPYRSPIDNRVHRYFPDFYIKVKQKTGKHKKFIIEVKPKNQCSPPTTTPKKRTSKWYNEVKTWGINEAKWKSAQEFCDDRGWIFKIITEKELGIRL